MLISATLLATGIVVALGFRFVATRRIESEGLARIQSRNLAQALDQSLTGTLQKIDLALGSVAGEATGTWRNGQLNHPRLEQLLATEGKLLPWPGIIWIADARGRAILGNRPIALVPSWESRWWFLYCRTHPDAGMVVSKPIIGFLTKKWVIPCVRRFNLPNGEFGGVVVIPLSLDYLKSRLSGYEIGPGGSLTVRDSDGGFIARFPEASGGPDLEIGSQTGTAELMKFVQSGASEVTHSAISSFDQKPRLYTMRRVKDAPLIVGAGLAEADYLAQWRGDRGRILTLMGLSLLGIWAISWLFWRAWKSQALNAEALSLSEERFRLAMDATSDGIWDWNVATGAVYYSPSYTRMLGYELDEFSARVDSWADLILPEDRARVLAANEACIQGACPSFEVEYRMRARDGAIRWILGRGKAIHRDEEGRALRMVGTHVDVTGCKELEAGLRESEERYRQLFNNAEVGMFRTRLDGSEILEFNEKYLELLGRTMDEVRQQPSVVVWADRRKREEMVRLLEAEGHVMDFEFEYLNARGEIRQAITSVKLFREEGILEGSIQDISARKQAEEENARLQAQLQQAQKMESLGTLAGGIAHDMNNVLTGILGMAELGLEEQPEGSLGHRSFQAIIRAAERAGKMVKSLLRFARQRTAEEYELELNEILREEVNLLERTTLSRIHLELDLAPDLRYIRGDAGALTHAFMNLCVNAVDAMPDNGTLTLRTRNVDSGWVEVLVEDTGVGMTKEVLEKAVDPFFTTKEVGKGTGLGLSMVYSTVKAHQGQLEIQSEPGRGTRVRIRFPSFANRTQAPEGEEDRPAGTVPRKLKVLLVDDDEIPRNTTYEVLTRMGHAALAVGSGEAALTQLEAGFQPDVVILDMNMPGLGGLATLPRLRTLFPKLPVIISTGRADQTTLDLTLNEPFVTLLPKPFAMEELRGRLERL